MSVIRLKTVLFTLLSISLSFAPNAYAIEKTAHIEPDLFEQYWLHALLVLTLLAQPLFFYIRRLKNNLRIDEEKLAQPETEWSNALDFLDEPMYMVDLEDKTIRANKAFYKKINSTAEESIGKVVTLFSHPEGEEIPCKICQARKNQIDGKFILEANDPINKDGKPLVMNY